MRDEWKIDFVENDIYYSAGKGFACAKNKNGKTLWSAMDVFRTVKPTRKAVLLLESILDFGHKGESVND